MFAYACSHTVRGSDPTRTIYVCGRSSFFVSMLSESLPVVLLIPLYYSRMAQNERKNNEGQKNPNESKYYQTYLKGHLSCEEDKSG